MVQTIITKKISDRIFYLVVVKSKKSLELKLNWTVENNLMNDFYKPLSKRYEVEQRQGKEWVSGSINLSRIPEWSLARHEFSSPYPRQQRYRRNGEEKGEKSAERQNCIAQRGHRTGDRREGAKENGKGS